MSHGDRRARRGARLRPGARRASSASRRAHLVLRQRRRALRRGDVQDARLRAALGRDHPRALRRHRRQAAALPLRRAGQLARPHRGPAREQRAAHRARDARRHAVEGRPGPRGPAARLERGARPAPPVGPAVVAAHPAGARLRDRPARVRRPVRRARPSSRPRSPSSSREPSAEIERVQQLGGAVAAVESRLHEERLVASHARAAPPDRGRARTSSSGVNRFETTEPNPLTADLDTAIQTVDAGVEAAAAAAVRRVAGGARRDPEREERAASALARLRRGAGTDTNLMAATLECARAGVTTGEWAGALREVFGEYRAPTGVSGRSASAPAPRRSLSVRARWWRSTSEELGEKLRLLVGKPGLDGHSNGAEQIAVRARDAGFEVVYQGIRLTPEQIVGGGRGRGRPPGRPLDPLGVAPGARAGGARAAARGRSATCRWSSAASSPRRMPCSSRRWGGRGVHPEGLRAQRHHGALRRGHPGLAGPGRDGARPRLSADGRGGAGGAARR